MKKLNVFVAALVLSAGVAYADLSIECECDAMFREPPQDARPQTRFHLIGGNVSKDGLTADLEALRAAGFGGIQLFTRTGRSGQAVAADGRAHSVPELPMGRDHRSCRRRVRATRAQVRDAELPGLVHERGTVDHARQGNAQARMLRTRKASALWRG